MASKPPDTNDWWGSSWLVHLYNKCLKLEITVFQSINIYDQYVDTWKLKVGQIVPDSRLTELVAPSVGILVFNTFLYIASSLNRWIDDAIRWS